jgi:hypothetical protein
MDVYLMKRNVIAVDLGASSGRIISASLKDGKMELKEQFRFSNQPIELTDSLYWDYLKNIPRNKIRVDDRPT